MSIDHNTPSSPLHTASIEDVNTTVSLATASLLTCLHTTSPALSENLGGTELKRCDQKIFVHTQDDTVLSVNVLKGPTLVQETNHSLCYLSLNISEQPRLEDATAL